MSQAEAGAPPASTEPSPEATARPKPVVPAAHPEAGERGTKLLVSDLRELAASRLFWVGVAMKVLCATLFGSHFATRWFAPFVHEFVTNGSNPWDVFLARGEPMAFPYGPAMLLALAPAWIFAKIVAVDPSGHVGLLLLRVPLLAADLMLCLLLKRWLRFRAVNIITAYWLSPIVLYATYVHGQVDLIPTALLCLALYLVFTRRAIPAAVVFGIALATKGHLVIALPFVVVYLLRQRHPRYAWATFAGVVIVVCTALYALPLGSAAFRTMVVGSAESRKIWSVGIPYGLPGLMLYAAPAALVLAFFRFFSYRKINRELAIMFLGVLYIGLVVLVPPQPGWFIWSLPFVAYFGARFSRAGRQGLVLLTVAYLLYFFVADPVVFLEALDPTLGAGFGERAAARLAEVAPGVFTHHGASIALTGLVASSALIAVEMYRKGVRSNALYGFRDQSFMVGIGGDSGAGKHTLANDMKSLFGETLSVINGDDDHRWERGHAMWKEYTHLDPRANFLAAQLDGLAALREGGNIRKRHYDHDKGKFTDPLLIKPNDFIAIVGLHPFYLASQRQVLHLKIYVGPSEELRREWKVKRDVAKRGYTPEKVLYEMDRRMADSAKYVQPQARHADLLVSHTKNPEKDTDVALRFELSSALDPLPLFHALGQVDSIEVNWLPDESLTRDQFEVKGELTIEQLQLLAIAAIPNVDELTIEPGGWKDGGRGLAQLVALYAASVRLRVNPSAADAAA